MSEARRALEERVREIESEMCCIEHPFHHVLCLRNIGHKGQHWFMVRWQDANGAMQQAADVLREISAGAPA